MKTLYPARIEQIDHWGRTSLVISFRDAPEVITDEEDTYDEVIYAATRALKFLMPYYLERDGCYPKPSAPQTGDVIIGVEL